MKKFKSKPFALVGVNSDSKRRLKMLYRDNEISWPSFWDDGYPGGTIASAWKVHAWPCLYVIDKKGVIRFPEVMGDLPVKEIEKLLDEK